MAMATFLGQLSDKLIERHSDHLTEICVVVPSKRSALFLRDVMLRKTGSSLRLPEVVSFDDFIQSVSTTTLIDKISLTFELYPIYHEVFPDEPFEKYYTWGALLTGDFEEIDRYLVDAEKLFVNLYELKRIDTTIDSWLNEDSKPTAFQQRYLDFWQKMGVFYQQLQERMKQRGLASPAMALREAAMNAAEIAARLPWREVVFAGFNALTPAEEKFIHTFLELGKAVCYWDMDSWYALPEMQEAGKFFRDLRLRWDLKDPEWVQDHLTGRQRTLTVTAVPERVGMAKAAGLKVRELLAAGVAASSIAIVLPDENLLFPLLHSLPAEIKDINVSMGFPLRSTPLFSLVEGLILLHENAERRKSKEESEEVYYFRDIKAILRHPYIHAVMWEEADELAKELQQGNRVYVTPRYFEKYADGHFFRFLFQPWTSIPQTTDFFLDFFRKLQKALTKDGSKGPAMELEYLLQFYLLTRRMRDRLDAYASSLDLDTFRRLFREVISSASIPFSGEPLNGLQVLGMLETRLLDFPHVIMLSVNEGIAPSTSSTASFIPYNLRKAFDLPTQDDKDAVSAYHFYRMLQRTSTATLLYNTETGTLGGGEPSRFIAQLRAELATAAPDTLTWKEETLTFPAHRQTAKEITVDKSEDVIASIRLFGKERGFSPSVLGAYLNCTLQFYFRYILRLKEREELSEELQANQFGELTHAVLEHLYKPFVGKDITAEDLDEMTRLVEETTHSAFKELNPTQSSTYGRNKLLTGVIRDLVTAVIEKDKEQAPFFLEALEEEIQFAFGDGPDGLIVKGVLDRVDHASGVTRILDYKTGAVDKVKLKEFSQIREGRKFREAFQLSVYAWLYLKSGKGPGPVRPAIYPLRNLSGGPLFLETGYTETAPLDLAALQPLEDELRSLFREMEDPELPFVQTEDEERCRFCEFVVICGRG